MGCCFYLRFPLVVVVGVWVSPPSGGHCENDSRFGGLPVGALVGFPSGSLRRVWFALRVLAAFAPPPVAYPMVWVRRGAELPATIQARPDL